MLPDLRVWSIAREPDAADALPDRSSIRGAHEAWPPVVPESETKKWEREPTRR